MTHPSKLGGIRPQSDQAKPFDLSQEATQPEETIEAAGKAVVQLLSEASVNPAIAMAVVDVLALQSAYAKRDITVISIYKLDDSYKIGTKIETEKLKSDLRITEGIIRDLKMRVSQRKADVASRYSVHYNRGEALVKRYLGVIVPDYEKEPQKRQSGVRELEAMYDHAVQNPVYPQL